MGKGALGQLAAYWPEDTARYAHVPLKRVGDLTLDAAPPEATALVSAAGPVTYGSLSARAKKLAASLRGRLARGSRVALALPDPLDLVSALFAGFEAEMCVFAADGGIDAALLQKFGAELLVGEGGVAIATLLSEEGSGRAERPDLKKPMLAFPKPDRSGEVLHKHTPLAATAIAIGSFFMLEPGSRVRLLDPPVDWLSLSLLLGAWQRGAEVWVGWGAEPAPEADRIDYLVTSWETASRRFIEAPPRIPRPRIGAGAIVGVEAAFGLSRRRRLARRIGAPVLTVLGRSDLGPAIASHPSWFLDDAVGIPLPNVDTRPMNPADGKPLNIGWDAVESAELGFKSALAPAGGTIVDEWLRSGIVAEIDPTGLYFLR
jgi:hypothetical protein